MKRLFSLFLLFFALQQGFLSAQEGVTRPIVPGKITGTERHRREIAEEASSELVNLNINDSEVSLIMSGFWKGSLSLNWGIVSSPLGVAAHSDDSPLLFTQEADLTLSLWVRKRWFLEVGFLDDYNLNTYRAGYQGFPGETVQYVGVGNTGLDFPVFPYLDLGGDSPSSFGAYGRFGSEDLTFHTLFRYDAAAAEERIFVGNRERSYSVVSPENPIRGRSFVLPRDDISVPVVYLEDKDGELWDGKRRWRLAKPSEYAASGHYGIVELVREAAGMAAVFYESPSGYNADMGAYNDGSAGAGISYLKSVQNHFAGIDLHQYPQPGQDAAPGTSANIPGTVTFNNGITALVIYEPGTFSPFERQSRYISPSSSSEDASLIRLSTGEVDSRYEILAVADMVLPLDGFLYSIEGDNSQRGIFEISIPGSGTDRRKPQAMWPLARDPAPAKPAYPAIYLPGGQAFTDDLRIRFINYGPAGAYTIGTDVVPGSVQVYRGGILDSQVSYNAGSGTVHLASPVGFNEVIRVVYLKRSEERRLGSLAAGLGLVYKPEGGSFSAEAALGARWNISQESYTEEGAASPGTVGLSGRASWDFNRLKASLSVGLGFEQPDTTGLYRIAGMEGNSEIVLSLSVTSGFLSKIPGKAAPVFPAPPPPPPSIPPSITSSDPQTLIYRNYRSSDIFGVSKLMSIDWSAPVVSGMEGPYPAMDADMDIFVAEFENLGPAQWTGFQVPLGLDRDLLERAKEIVIPIRFYGVPSNAPVLVIAQFGTMADDELNTIENPNLVVEAPLFYGSTVPAGWIEKPDSALAHTIAISLDDGMRSKLQNATHMRILIVNSGTGGINFEGRLLVAKPYVKGSAWRGIKLDGSTLETSGSIEAAEDNTLNGVTVVEERDTTLPNTELIKRTHPDNAKQLVLKASWRYAANAAGVDGRTGTIPLSEYRTLGFYLKGPSGPASGNFRFIAARGPDFVTEPGAKALDVSIPQSALPAGWSRIEIHYGGDDRYVSVNGTRIGAVPYYNPNALKQSMMTSAGLAQGDGQSAYIAAFVENPSPADSFSIDEICLEDPAPAYRFNTGTSLDWVHPEAVLSIGNTAVVSDLRFNTVLETGLRGDPFIEDRDAFMGAQSRSSAGLTLLGAKITGSLSFMLSNDTSYWSGGHEILRTFGPLSISETFDTAPHDGSLYHQFSLNLGTLVRGLASADMIQESTKTQRRWNVSTALDPVLNGRPGFSLGGELIYTGKNPEAADKSTNYAAAWAKSWARMIPDQGTEQSMQSRDAQGRVEFVLNRLPLGTNLSFEGTSSVSLPQNTTRSVSTGRIDFPFSFGNVQGVLRGERGFRRTLYYAGQDLEEDLSLYGGSLYDSRDLWLSIPLFAIFDPHLDDALNTSLRNDSENTRFNELFALTLQFPERYDPLSLIIPVSFFSQLDRSLEQRLDTKLDVLTLSASLGFSGTNLFGAMGSNSLFSFYRNDELRHSVTGIVSFPRTEEALWKLQAEQSLGFFGFKDAVLEVVNTLTVGSTGWMESLSLLWTVPEDSTILSFIYDLGISRLANNDTFPALKTLAASKYERLRKESLEIIIDRTAEDYGQYSCILGHESVVRIIGRLNLSVFAKLNISRNDYSDTLSFMLTLGTSLTISF